MRGALSHGLELMHKIWRVVIFSFLQLFGISLPLIDDLGVGCPVLTIAAHGEHPLRRGALTFTELFSLHRVHVRVVHNNQVAFRLKVFLGLVHDVHHVLFYLNGIFFGFRLGFGSYPVVAFSLGNKGKLLVSKSLLGLQTIADGLIT